MNLHSLKPAKGAKIKPKKRIGRGQGSGKGGTAARGHKGAKSRSGFKNRRHSEGGQMPLQRRIPKRGFKNINRKEYKTFNLDQLEIIAAKYEMKEINPENLYVHKFINRTDLVKVLGRGEITQAYTLRVNAITETAKKAIEEKGGSVEIV
jgi:large subunit ribosomal protein L15